MVRENSQGKHWSRAVMLLVGVAALLALAVVIVRPWSTSAESQRDSAVRSAQEAGTTTVSVPVEGMFCGLCAASVKRTVQGLEGVTDAEVDLQSKRAKISYVEGKASPEQIAAAIARAGFKPGVPAVENHR